MSGEPEFPDPEGLEPQALAELRLPERIAVVMDAQGADLRFIALALDVPLRVAHAHLTAGLRKCSVAAGPSEGKRRSGGQ